MEGGEGGRTMPLGGATHFHNDFGRNEMIEMSDNGQEASEEFAL